MQLQTFHGTSMADALTRVKTALGTDAVILHTRTVQQRRWLGLRRTELFEITAGRGAPVRRSYAERPGSASQGRTSPGAAQLRESVATLSPSAAERLNRVPAGYSSPAARTNVNGAGSGAAGRSSPANSTNGSGSSAVAGLALPGRALLDSPAVGNVAIVGLTQEMGQLKTMMKDLVTQVRTHKSPQVPEELFEYYLQLVENYVADEIAVEIVKSVKKSMRPELLTDAVAVRARLAEHLEKLIPAAGPIIRTKINGPHVVALIGPTGVGKTTTIAKLAANLKLREKRKVGLITIDTFRIAAIEQLKRYAEILSAPLRVVGTPEDMPLAIQSMSDCDFILIDTAGRSPKDSLKLSELKRFLQLAEPEEVYLVLSSTASEPCVDLAMERFGEISFDKLIFTKLDEAAQVGTVFNVARKLNKKLAYFTTGQDVPDDIEVCHGRRLAQMILGQDKT